MRILIVKTSSMGDVVHALPMVDDLRRAEARHRASRPAAAPWRIDWLVEPAFAALPELHPGVDGVHRLPWRKWRKALGQGATWKAMGALQDTLRAARYDWVIDAQGLLKSAWWARRAGAPVIGYDRHSIREPLASFLYHRTARVDRGLHAIDRCRQLALAALAAAGSASSGSVSPASTPTPPTALAHPPVFGLEGLAPLPAEAAGCPPGPYAVLIPNASRPEKYWPNADWQAVGQVLRSRGWIPVVLWGSPAELQMAQSIAQECSGVVPPFLTVAQAAQLLSGAEVVVGLDTGFSHIAAATGRPVVGIYCDHEPGLTGITGAGPGASLGGKGQRPTRSAVLEALDAVLHQSSTRCVG